MSLEKEKKKFFNECMRCKNAVKKRMIDSKEWTIACVIGNNDHFWCVTSYERRYYREDEAIEMLQNCCPYFTEKMVESWNEE